MLGTVALCAPIVITGCGSDEAPSASNDTSEARNRAQVATCVTAGQGDAGIRQALVYVDESPNAEKDCANCKFFKEPARDEACGGCTIITGPIAPAGYCNSWVARMI